MNVQDKLQMLCFNLRKPLEKLLLVTISTNILPMVITVANGNV